MAAHSSYLLYFDAYQLMINGKTGRKSSDNPLRLLSGDLNFLASPLFDSLLSRTYSISRILARAYAD